MVEVAEDREIVALRAEYETALGAHCSDRLLPRPQQGRLSAEGDEDDQGAAQGHQHRGGHGDDQDRQAGQVAASVRLREPPAAFSGGGRLELSDLGTCDGCGLEIAGGTHGCQALFDQFRLRESAELAHDYGPTRLTIDTYSVQHPDRYCVSAKSLAAHLTGLCWALERGGSEAGLRALQRWRNRSVPLHKPGIPKDRGQMTVAPIARGRETPPHPG